jgi:hypothetical protein
MTPAISFRYVENFPKMHQRSNTECGMYSLFFIITMLTGGENRDVSITAGVNKLPKQLVELHGGIRHGMSMEERIHLFTKERIPDNFVENFRGTYYNRR